MSAFEDEIALLASDIRRWAGQDARIHEALEQLIKLYEAEVNALAFEALELERKAPEAVVARPVAARPWGSWGRQAGAMDDGDWRQGGIA